MRGTLRHFAINADDFGRARRFYEQVFGWSYRPWGPPDFVQTQDAGEGLWGALHSRRDIGGRRMPGIELTFGVDDLDETVKAIEAAGGRILMQPAHIQTVGRLVWFEDTEGNIAGAMQYESGQ